MRRIGTAVLATALLAGCGGGGEKAEEAGRATVVPRGERVLASVRGATGATLELRDVRRTVRVVTVRFRVILPRDAGEAWDIGYDLSPPRDMSDSDSVAGTSLIDDEHGRTHAVLRGDDGSPLCSVGLEDDLATGQSVDLFAKFPAPPAGTREVSLAVPTFPAVDGITFASWSARLRRWVDAPPALARARRRAPPRPRGAGGRG